MQVTDVEGESSALQKVVDEAQAWLRSLNNGSPSKKPRQRGKRKRDNNGVPSFEDLEASETKGASIGKLATREQGIQVVEITERVESIHGELQQARDWMTEVDSALKLHPPCDISDSRNSMYSSESPPTNGAPSPDPERVFTMLLLVSTKVAVAVPQYVQRIRVKLWCLRAENVLRSNVADLRRCISSLLSTVGIEINTETHPPTDGRKKSRSRLVAICFVRLCSDFFPPVLRLNEVPGIIAHPSQNGMLSKSELMCSPTGGGTGITTTGESARSKHPQWLLQRKVDATQVN
jgi:hypothetical protein